MFRICTLIVSPIALGVCFVPALVQAAEVGMFKQSQQTMDDSLLLAQQDSPEFEYEDFDFWADQCRLLSQEEDYEKTIETCERAISLEEDEDNIDLWTARSDALFQLGSYLEAIASYNRVLRVAPESSISMAYQCAALFQLNRYDDAIDTCESALQVNGNWGNQSPAMAWYYRGLSLQAIGRLETALDSFQRAVNVDPDDVVAQAGLCALESDLHPFEFEFSQVETCPLDTAVSVYERALAVRPDNPTLWLEQGLVLEQLGDYERALTSYEQASSLLPDYSLVLAHQCAVLVHLEDYESALEACEAALEGNNNWGSRGEEIGSAYGWTQKSAALIGLGQYEEALAAAERAIAIAPDYSVGWNNKAVSQWYLDELDAGFSSIETAINLYTEALVRYQDDQDIRGEAFELEHYESTLFFHRSRIIALFNKGRISTSRKDFDIAIQAYQEAIQVYEEQRINWGFPIIDNRLLSNIYVNQATAYILETQNLGSSCANFRSNSGEAISSANAATAIYPDLFANWYTLGLVQLYSCNYQLAQLAFEDAIEREPENIYAMTGLGIALAGAANTQDAVEVFEQVLNINPSYSLAQSCRDYLVLGAAESDECARWLP